jgi:predicted PurR-regulated permease PerM
VNSHAVSGRNKLVWREIVDRLYIAAVPEARNTPGNRASVAQTAVIMGGDDPGPGGIPESSGSPTGEGAVTGPKPQSHGMTAANDTAAQSSRLPRGLILVLALAGILVAVLAIRQFAALVAPVLLALVLVVAVHPLTGYLRRRGLPKWAASTVTLVATLGVILGLAAAVALSIAQLATILPDYEDRFVEILDNFRAWLASLGVGPDELRTALAEISFSKVANLLTVILAGLVSTFSNLLFLLFVLAFMAVDADGFASRISHVRRSHPNVVGALDTFVYGTRRYLLVSTVFGFVVAALDTSFLWIAGVPLPLLWGLLAFITNYIPNVGFIIGVIPPALLGLLEGGPGLMIGVIVAYAVINFIIQSIIQPKFVSDAVNLSLTVTFLSLAFWTLIIGPVGAILAVPLTLLAKALLFDVDPSTRWMSSLLAGGPAPEDGDADEASDRKPEAAAAAPSSAADGQDRLPGQDLRSEQARPVPEQATRTPEAAEPTTPTTTGG